MADSASTLASTSSPSLYVEAKKVKKLFGTSTGFLRLDRGATLMAPSSQTVCSDKGRLLELEGGSLAAQAAVVYAILVRLTPQGQLDTITDQSAKCWSYISPGGQRQGPFEARKLLAWHNKGQLPGSFHVEHGPSRVWLPLSLLARHHALLERAAAGMCAEGPGAADTAYAPVHWPVPLDTDVLMSDAEVAAEIAQLRHAERFLVALDGAVTMEVDTSGAAAPAGPGADGALLQQLLQETQPLSLPAPMDVDVDLAASAGAAAGPAPRLYLVLDTNVLLRRDGMALLHTLRQRFAGPSAASAEAAGAGKGAEAAAGGLSCVAVVPWTVLAELDGLKSAPIRAQLGGAAAAAARDEDDEEERPVAVAARSALSLLRSALEAGDRFFRGQSLAQFRAAACHPAAAIPLGAARITPDDRILQCALHLQDQLVTKSEASGRAHRVALLSNDNALCIKAQVCGLAAASTQQLRAVARTSSAGGVSSGANGAGADPQGAAAEADVSALRAALLALAEAAGGNSARASHSGAASASIMPDSATAAPFSIRISDSGAGPGGGSADAAAAAGGAAAALSPSGAAGGELVGPYEEVSASEDPLLYVLRAELYRLTLALAPVVRDIMVAEYEELWTGVLVKPPPWSDADLLEVLQRHMESVFAGRLGRGMARQAAPALDAMLKDFWYFERGRGRPRRELKHLERAEAFVQQVDEMLAAFGVVRPPPATCIPPALLALRPGGGSRPGAGPAWMGSAGADASAGGMMGISGGQAMARPPPPPPAGLQSSLSGGMGVNGLGLGGGLSLVSSGLSGGMSGGMGGAGGYGGGGGVGAPAGAPERRTGRLGTWPHDLAGRCPGGGGGALQLQQQQQQQQALHQMQQAQQAQQAQQGKQQHQYSALQQQQQQQQQQQGSGIDMKAVLLAAQAAGASGGAADPALAQLLQVLMQQQQQQQQGGAGGARSTVPPRANSESGRPATGAASAEAALAQQLLLVQQQQQQQQQLMMQQQMQKQQLLQRFHSVPQPMEPGGLPSSAQAEAAALQMQMLQLQASQQQKHQQQAAQAQQQQQLALLQQHDSQQRQQAQQAQQQQHLQLLLQQQQQQQQAEQQQKQMQKQAMAARSEGAAGGASALTAGLTPELMAMLQQHQQIQQQQHQQQMLQMQMQQQGAFGAAPSPRGHHDDDEDGPWRW
ncbi:hypothetical protein HXX76_011339 [Chlamydomonas incerta]|uniref:GYF domain-containing protein n=1 Tax=Chlamydomonas incerta TaxID=51695 RepID=A0A835SK32_CHLIN|nr:hypothetical protein HXX76_011339 [Chlamydomonas incerta]|eukprot:KAG2428632.1 hypothetical protein HXX76_011339 [Chlamydomonas incerta]